MWKDNITEKKEISAKEKIDKKLNRELEKQKDKSRQSVFRVMTGSSGNLSSIIAPSHSDK